MKDISNQYSVVKLVIVILLTTVISYQCQTNYRQSADSTKTKSWFKVKQVADKVWRIDDNGGDFMYLVEGDEKALLIDTGRGYADLLAYIKSITKLPLMVVNTHGHHDHACGNFQFKQVYAHPNDFNLIHYCCNETYRANTIKQLLANSPESESLIMKEVNNYTAAKLIPVKNGYIFNLGNRKLEVIETQGHTLGSICLLDAENKLLFAGDNNNKVVWLFLKGCLPLEIYLQNLEKLKLRANDFDTILAGHCEPLDKSFIDEQITCIKNILDGTCKGESYEPYSETALSCTFKRAQVAYDPNNLRTKK